MNMFFPDTPARRVIRIIRSYGLALRHPAAPARHRSLPGRATCPASEPAACQARAKVGIFPRKKIPVLPWGEDCSTLFFANGCEAPAARHSPAAPARHRSPRQGRDSSYRGRDSDFALHRGRFSDFALASDFARKNTLSAMLSSQYR